MSEIRNDGSIILTAIGNPIVDVEVIVQDSQFFEQHGIPFDGQRPESTEFLATLKEDFKRRNYKTMIFPGGCAQNTSRVFQWLMVSKFQSCMIGAVGGDDEGTFLKNRLEQDGVKPCYVVVNNWQTYNVFVFVYQNSRFIAYPQNNRGAAGNYSMSHFLGHTEALRSIENSNIVFIEGFFTEHSPQVALRVLDMCVTRGIVTSFNLCGVNVVEQYFEKSVEPFLKRCNVVVGNMQEFKCLCTKLDIPSEDMEQAAIKVHRMMMFHVPSSTYRVKSLERYKKILIVTNGEEAVLCVTGDSDGLIKYIPPSLEHSKIKDTTGAGDSFIAGFLYGLAMEQPILRCLEIGCRVAANLIQQYGSALPETKIDFLADGSKT